MIAMCAALLVGAIAAVIMVSTVGRNAGANGIPEPNRTIFLSPSVQYDNLYACGDTNEGEQMQLLADLLEPILTEKCFTVYRNNPQGSLSDSVALSNQKDIGLHLALHTNASQNGETRGCEAFIRLGSGSRSKYMANILVDHITSLGTKSRGVKKTTSLYETNNAQADAVVLLEIDFHDNEDGSE